MMRPSRWLRSAVQRVLHSVVTERLTAEIDTVKLMTAKLLVNHVRRLEPNAPIAAAEFKVFSQFGEDGIIQYLLHVLGPTVQTFVEFGVEDYREATTRLLLVQDNWRGLVIDGSVAHVAAIKRQDIYWRHNLTALAAFVDRENINDLISSAGFQGEIGLLGIDIDGNDYWVWEQINCVSPVLVVAEYNAIFGPLTEVTIPYDSAFVRSRAHYSNLYFGASLGALCRMANRKGYDFVGCNTAGNNAFFVRRDRRVGLPALTAEQGFVNSTFREARGRSGNLTYATASDAAAVIAHLPVYDLAHEQTMSIGQALHLASEAAARAHLR